MADTAETEVVNETAPVYGQARPMAPMHVCFDKTTLLRSPAFWFAGGIVFSFVMLYLLKRELK